MHILRWVGIGTGAVVLGIAAAVAFGIWSTERDIQAFRDRVEAIAVAHQRDPADSSDWQDLPAPVARYFAFVFPDGPVPATHVSVAAKGQFRRPLTDSFSTTTSEQVIAVGTPALMFSATTPVLPGVSARAYDFFAEGEMEMRAKIASLLTVVDERETPELNVISLRRWLLESALFPQALLPVGPVTWEPIDDTRARAIVEADGLRATMIAQFADDGRMTAMIAEEEGDLTTPYHGSGEHVTRSDYRLVDGVMIPHRFVISRASGGEIFPFFDAALTLHERH